MEKLNQELPDGQGADGRHLLGDIGCYTLGNAKASDMVDTCLCMGAGHHYGPRLAEGGAADVETFGFIGDSTFFASG